MGILSFTLVGIGAAIGAWSRWLLGVGLNTLFPLLPLGTLFANLIGGYLMGLMMGLITIGANITPEIRLLIMTGFLGGLTTFSTFSGESVTLFSRGEYGWASLHIAGHLLGALMMTALGLFTVQLFKS